MATSPRNEYVVTRLIEFARLEGKWFWRMDNASEVGVAQDEYPYNTLDDAVAAFFAFEGVDPTKPVHPTEAHYSVLQKSTDDSYHIRRYKFGAPEPIQAVAS